VDCPSAEKAAQPPWRTAQPHDDDLTRIARLGGYLAHASDPSPGNIVMWRGMSRLTDITLGTTLQPQLGRV
jgi:hypothetical protein